MLSRCREKVERGVRTAELCQLTSIYIYWIACDSQCCKESGTLILKDSRRRLPAVAHPVPYPLSTQTSEQGMHGPSVSY